MPVRITARQRLELPPALPRVSRQLSLWDELDVLAVMPPTLRPWVEVPALDREQLESLRVELIGALGEQETCPDVGGPDPASDGERLAVDELVPAVRGAGIQARPAVDGVQ